MSWSDFTEAGYRRLLDALLKHGYTPARYGESPEGRHVIWRHDVDLSLQRALWTADAEAERGVVATYFVNPHSDFYSLAEPVSRSLIDRIAAGGHEIGLHFDAQAFATTHWEAGALEEAIAGEAELVRKLTGRTIASVSWHNPDLSNLLEFDAETIGGLWNAYSRRLRTEYVYCSDSNGYWRYRPMGEVIAEGHERLHLLTHPGWWVPEALPPRARIGRAVAGRAAATLRAYDATLVTGKRSNLVR